MRLRRLALSALVLILLLILVLVVAGYKNNSSRLSIDGIRPGYTFSLYESEGEAESTAYNKDRLVFRTTSNASQRVKHGNYVYVVSGNNNDLKSYAQSITVDKTSIKISVPVLGYTDKKLANLLAVEEPLVKSILQNRYPFQMQLYSVQSSKLYKNGDWYGAKLVPNDTGSYDTLRVVLKKEKGVWKIVTQPPEPVISKPVYPEIPTEILTDINNFL